MKTVMKRTLIAMIMVLAVGLMVGTSAQAKSKKKNTWQVCVMDGCYGTKSKGGKSTWTFYEMDSGNKHYLSVYYNGVDVTKKAKYKSSNKKVATVKKGVVTYKHMQKDFTLTVSYKEKKLKVKIISAHKDHDFKNVYEKIFWEDNHCISTTAQYAECSCGAVKFISGDREAFVANRPKCHANIYVGNDVWETANWQKYK